jgi:protein-disulfide isomerase
VTTPAVTRRERRAEQREVAKESERRRRAHPKRSGWRSPFVLATAGALVAGILLIGALVLTNRPASTGAAVLPAEVPSVEVALVHGRALGDPNAPVTIELWSDFQCPVCERFATTLEPRLRTSYLSDGRVRLVYRDFAFLGSESVDAAAGARIAEELGLGFWPFHDLLYANHAGENLGAFSRDRLADIAAVAGLDRSAFATALKDPRHALAVNQETGQGHALGVNSTPTLVINGTVYPGLPDWAKLTAVLDALLSERTTP